MLAEDITDPERAHSLLEALEATNKTVRSLVERMRTSIEMYSEEGMVANAGDTQLALEPARLYSGNILRIDTILFQGPQGCTSWTLKIGQRVYTFASPTTGGFWQNLHMLVKPEEVRTLSWAGATAAGGGDAFLNILGVQLPEVNF